MKDSSSGFSSVYALTVIFILLVIMMSVSLYFGTEIKKAERIESLYEREAIADSVMLNVLEDFQDLIVAEFDFVQTEELLKIRRKYESYKLEISDVSTGINKSFLSEKVKAGLETEKLVEVKGEDIIVSYGWINEKYAEESFIAALHEEHRMEDLFPLVCSFPFNNVNFMEEEHIEAVLKYFEIKESKKKAYEIVRKQDYGISEEQLLGILKCKKEAKVLDFLGVKTSFWELKMEVADFKINAVIAAVPDKENQRKVSKYILIKKNIKRT